MTISLIDQSPSDLISREELVSIAQGEGMTLTSRTLRYWASKGWIPYPWRVEGQGPRAFYPLSLLERLRVLSAIRPQRLRSLRENVGEAETISFGEESFSVLPVSAHWERDNTEFSLRMLEDGSGMLLIQRKKSMQR
jgi:hypothetical protein